MAADADSVHVADRLLHLVHAEANLNRHSDVLITAYGKRDRDAMLDASHALVHDAIAMYTLNPCRTTAHVLARMARSNEHIRRVTADGYDDSA